MQTGQYISGALHLGVILWAMVGGILFRPSSDPVTPQSTSVTLISAAELDSYAAVVPEVETAPSDAPEAPQITESPEAPDTTAEPAEPEPAPIPEVAEAPEPEAIPLSPAPPPPAPRVAPEIAPEPAPEAEIAPEVQTATTPEPGPEVAEEAQQETAPEAATTQIVTEATETSEELAAVAPTAATRPPPRPPRPEPEPEVDPVADAVAAAVADAAAAPATPRVPAGPPMTDGEKDALRVAVQSCWNVGALSTDALAVTVTVGVSMSPDGKPVANSLRLLSATGGSDAAANQAYETARRAIIRCGARGFDLPSEKYAQWQEIEMTFNPERMRIK